MAAQVGDLTIVDIPTDPTAPNIDEKGGIWQMMATKMIALHLKYALTAPKSVDSIRLTALHMSRGRPIG